jgi:hypothetical protein
MGLQNNGNGLVLGINVLNGLVDVGIDLRMFSMEGIKDFFRSFGFNSSSESKEQFP